MGVNPMRFEFATAGRIIFGPGTLQEAGPIASKMGHNALVVTSGQKRAAPLLDLLEQRGIVHTLFTVESEPTTKIARQGTQQARDHNCDFVIGVGGGSVLDSGKAIAALLANGGDPLDYLEVIGRGQLLTKPSAPYMAIPHNGGNRSRKLPECGAGLTGTPRQGQSTQPYMLPDVALVDPNSPYSLPPDVTAYTGLDALTQLIEPYVSVKANPMTDALCIEGFGVWPARYKLPMNTATILRRVKIWRWRVFSAGWRWPMRR